jgi:hypothetical protein
MQTVHDLMEKFTSGDLPAGTLLGVGVVLLLIALKVNKAIAKSVFVLLALLALAGAAWWYLHRR